MHRFETAFGQPIHPNFYVARVLGLRIGKHEGGSVHGAGMGMRFDLVHRLGYALYDDGYVFTHGWLWRKLSTTLEAQPGCTTATPKRAG